MSIPTQPLEERSAPNILLQMLLDTSPTGIVHLRPLFAADQPGELLDFAYVRLNPAAQRLLGLPEYPAGTVLAQTSQAAAFDFYRDTFRRDKVGRFTLDGFGGQLAVVAQRDGPLLVASLTELATPPASASLPQLEEHRLLHQLFAQTPAAICLLRGPEFRIEYANPTFERLLVGRQLVGQPLAAVAPEAEQQGYLALLQQVYQTGETFFDNERPLTIERPDGQAKVHYFNFTYQAHPENGAPARLSIFAYEVTAQVQARQQREQLQQEWQRIFDQTPVAMAVLRGPHHVIELANPAMSIRWGRTTEQVVNRPVFEALPEWANKGIEQQLAAVLATGEPYVNHALPTSLWRDGQLTTVYWDLIYQPLRAADGHIEGVAVVANEVTEQLLVRQRVQELNDELHTVNEELLTTNEELRSNYDELVGTQHQLWLLNQELESRVAAGIKAAQQARDAAERQRQRLARFFQQVPAAICIFDGPSMVFELVNTDYQRLVPGRQLRGRPMLEALPELTGSLTWQTLQQVYQTGETHEEIGIRVALARYEGGPLEDFYLHYIQQARYDEQGRIDGVLMFTLNITEQLLAHKRAEKLQAEVLAATQRQAQEREAFYQVFEQTPAVVALMWGPEHRFEYFNQAFERLFPRRALRGYPIAEALPEAVTQGLVALLDQVYSTGEPRTYSEVPLVLAEPGNPAPKRIYLNLAYQAYREHGQTRGVSVFAYDVTAQVRARQRREAQQRELEQLFRQAPAPIVILDGPDLVFQMVNPAYQRIFPGRALAGRPLLHALPELANTPIPALFQQVLQTGEPYEGQEMPLLMARYEGGPLQEIYWTFSYQPRRNDQGAVDGIWVFAYEMTDQVRARQALAESARQAQALAQDLLATNAQLTRTNADLDNFIYTASHDLKAPIANIEGLLLLLRKQLPTEARQAGLVPRVLDMMQGAIERFQLTIAQLTDLAKLQQAYTQPAEEVDLVAVVEAVRLDLAPLLEESHAQLDIDLDGCTTVSFAPQHLRSLIYNLLSNAVKYRHPDRPPVVHLRCHHTHDTTILDVQDNGLGLTPDQQAKLFGMFRRMHAHVAGSGIGLYMVKRMVENVGGTITVQSQPDVGSIFTVTIPTHRPS